MVTINLLIQESLYVAQILTFGVDLTEYNQCIIRVSVDSMQFYYIQSLGVLYNQLTPVPATNTTKYKNSAEENYEVKILYNYLFLFKE